ncbi:MAG TPA: two-component regulator propeller domain-containing protein, partial [Thermoanaerobaculia bacterium]|nr:two-component regulator propeller domain-containing protein [Thermoanaerobaculia bacterium]
MVAAAILLAAGVAHAGTMEPLATAPGWVHEVFGVEDGLPAAGILDLVQTRDGFLWLATFDGLVRFDGVRFEVFDGEREPALGSDRVVKLLESADGTLWILSEQGHVARRADGVFTACGDATGGPAPCDLTTAGPAAYHSLHETPDGSLWFGGRSGLYRYVDGAVRRLESFRGPGRVRVVLGDRDGRLWVATASGLWLGDELGFEAVDLGGLGPTPVGSLARDGDGTLWAGLDAAAVGSVRSGRFVPMVEEGGHVLAGPGGEIWFSLPDRLLRQTGVGLETVAVKQPQTNHGVNVERAFASDQAGGTWTAWSRQLLRDGRPVLRLPESQAWVSSVLADRDGTVWAATTLSGELHAFRPALVDTVVDGLPVPAVYTVYEDRDGSLWAADAFLAVLDPDGGRFRVASGETPQRVRALLRDRQGILWVGTGWGLYAWDQAGFDGPHGPDALRNTHVHTLVEGSGGVLWAGTRDGLFRRGPTGTWSQPGRQEPAVSRVRVIHEMADGTLWLGTDGNGVVRLRGGAFTVIDRRAGLSSDLVRAIWPAPDGHLWIATERGLNRLDPNSPGRSGGPEAATLGTAQGLHDTGIHQLVADGLGNLWMSSNHGIFHARLTDLEAVADGRRRRVECVVYDERDGMLDSEANGGSQQAGLRDREGRLWFPTQAGVVRVDPRRALRPAAAPPVYVEAVRANGEELDLGTGTVSLAPDQRSFEIDFTAPTSRSPDRLHFRYRLLPYDESWQQAGTRRQAFYTKLPPGRYRFEVTVHGNGLRSPRPAVLDLVVTQRFAESSWFVGGMLLLAAALAFGALQLHVARIRHYQRQLVREVEHHTAIIVEQAERLRRVEALSPEALTDGPDDGLEEWPAEAL